MNNSHCTQQKPLEWLPESLPCSPRGISKIGPHQGFGHGRFFQQLLLLTPGWSSPGARPSGWGLQKGDDAITEKLGDTEGGRGREGNK